MRTLEATQASETRLLLHSLPTAEMRSELILPTVIDSRVNPLTQWDGDTAAVASVIEYFLLNGAMVRCQRSLGSRPSCAEGTRALLPSAISFHPINPSGSAPRPAPDPTPRLEGQPITSYHLFVPPYPLLDVLSFAWAFT